MSDPQSMPTASSVALVAEARAMVYAVLASAWCFPDESLVALWLEREGSDHAAHALEALPSEVNGRLRELREALHQLRKRSAVEALEDVRAAHGRLFGHSVRGACPAYELEYGRGEIIQQTSELADLGGFYSAFGMQVNAQALERSDHVSVECEFLSVLCAKESWGLREGHSELVAACSDAQRLFLRDHLAKWLPAFAHRVMNADRAGLYGCFASLAGAFIAAECRTFDLEAGPQLLELRPVDPERDTSIDCETAECGEAAANRLVQLGVESR